jgi:hypothetical protein
MGFSSSSRNSFEDESGGYRISAFRKPHDSGEIGERKAFSALNFEQLGPA